MLPEKILNITEGNKRFNMDGWLRNGLTIEEFYQELVKYQVIPDGDLHQLYLVPWICYFREYGEMLGEAMSHDGFIADDTGGRISYPFHPYPHRTHDSTRVPSPAAAVAYLISYIQMNGDQFMSETWDETAANILSDPQALAACQQYSNTYHPKQHREELIQHLGITEVQAMEKSTDTFPSS